MPYITHYQDKLKKNLVQQYFAKDAKALLNKKQKVILKNLYILKFLNQILNKKDFVLLFQYGSLSLVEKCLLKNKLENLKLNSFFFYPAQKELIKVISLLLKYKLNKSLFFFLESFRGNFFLISGKNSSLINLIFIKEEFKALLIKGLINNVLYDHNNLLLFFKLINQEKYKYLIEIYQLFLYFKLILSLGSFNK